MTDPRDIIDKSAMTTMQFVIVAITVFLNAMDGFDVLAISVAGPGIMGEYGIDRAQLGAVLSMELIGMAIGSIFLGGVADDQFGAGGHRLGGEPADHRFDVLADFRRVVGLDDGISARDVDFIFESDADGLWGEGFC